MLAFLLSSTYACVAQGNTGRFIWKSSPSSNQGGFKRALQTMFQGSKEHGTAGLLVIKNDRIACDLASMKFKPNAGKQALFFIPNIDLIAVRFGRLMKEDNWGGGMETYY